ncbi:hypothetical protein KM043_005105 [Ampulex compressa]|nr:hypothetical protein KM043_005105 [Ampulex compressa]
MVEAYSLCRVNSSELAIAIIGYRQRDRVSATEAVQPGRIIPSVRQWRGNGGVEPSCKVRHVVKTIPGVPVYTPATLLYSKDDVNTAATSEVGQSLSQGFSRGSVEFRRGSMESE